MKSKVVMLVTGWKVRGRYENHWVSPKKQTKKTIAQMETIGCYGKFMVAFELVGCLLSFDQGLTLKTF
jgi:hypothetical protein